MNIQMVDLKGQYQKIKKQVNESINKCLDDATFINGPAVKEFQKSVWIATLIIIFPMEMKF